MMDQLRGNVAVFAHGKDADSAAIERLKNECPEIDHVELFCVEKESDLLQLSSIQTARSPYDAILTWNKEVTLLSKQLHTAQSLLNPDGVLRLWTTADKNSALLALVIAGFVDVQEIPGDEIAFAPCKSDGAEKSQCFSARRPQFTVGESVKMPQQDKKSTAISHSARKWKLTEEDDEFIDEDSLLDDTEEVRKAAKNDCGVSANGKRRACKNCTCGRAETENASNPVVSDQELSQMVSSCGNCFKGDAFRCGGCPFLGKPAFKPGMEKVVLNLDSSDDI